MHEHVVSVGARSIVNVFVVLEVTVLEPRSNKEKQNSIAPQKFILNWKVFSNRKLNFDNFKFNSNLQFDFSTMNFNLQLEGSTRQHTYLTF